MFFRVTTVSEGTHTLDPMLDATPPFAFANQPHSAQCTPELWSLAKCCSPAYAGRTDLRKWEQLLTGYGVKSLMTPRPWQVGHVHLVEPLSVAAFISAIHNWKKRASAERGFVLDIGMNVGFYTWLASAIAPELVGLIGVDMQPTCVEVAECGLRLAACSRIWNLTVTTYIKTG